MAYECDYCLKTVDHGHAVSHAKNRTRLVRKPNLHRARVLENGRIVRRLLCTKCLRSADRPDWRKQAEEKKKEEEKK